MTDMKIGATVAYSHFTSPEFIAESAQVLEQMGFHSIWVPEHVMFFPDYESAYPYTEEGKLPGDPEGVLDPFTALTFVAANTKTLRLGTGICLVPQRQPAPKWWRIWIISPVAGWTLGWALAGSKKSSTTCKCPGRGAASAVSNIWR